MSKLENRCANCGGKFGLVYHNHWGQRFCRKACKDDFLAKTAKDHARMRKWFGRAVSRKGLAGNTSARAGSAADEHDERQRAPNPNANHLKLPFH